MEELMKYVKPELLIVAVVLYFLGIALKKIQKIANWTIPFILGAIGIVLCAIYVFATSRISSAQSVAMAVFTAVTQGILVAGLSTYVDQITKQFKRQDK